MVKLLSFQSHTTLNSFWVRYDGTWVGLGLGCMCIQEGT